MMMNAKLVGLVAATTLATALAATSAGAVTAVSNGDSVDIASDNLFLGDVKDASGGAGMFKVTFTSTSPGSAKAEVSILSGVASTFENLMMSWTGEDESVISTTSVTPVITSLSTMFMDPDRLNQNLVFSWSDSLSNVGFDFEVTTEISPIPVPAAGLLLLTGIAGLGALRSRRKASAEA